jgi:hypothetical protein
MGFFGTYKDILKESASDLHAIDKYASHPNKRIRHIAASSEVLSPHLFSVFVLPHEKDIDVRSAAAANKATPLEVLAILSQDEYWVVRRRVALNSNTPKYLLNVLARDPEEDVRQAAVKNPNWLT